MDVTAVISSCNLSEARFLLDHFMTMALNKVPAPFTELMLLLCLCLRSHTDKSEESPVVKSGVCMMQLIQTNKLLSII